MKTQLAANIFLLILIAVLSALAGYFYTQSKSNKIPNVNPTTTIVNPENSLSSQPSVINTVAQIGSGPSSPAKTHKVEKGETLYPIGVKYNIDWLSIAEANGLKEPYKIIVDQLLIIPTIDTGKNINQIDYQLNQEKAQQIQKDTESGKLKDRLDPAKTAQLDAIPSYGISNTDNFILKANEQGRAIVNVSHNNKNYQITLNQPIEQGQSGIWAIVSIKQTK